ncbi:hypothetical protein [Thiolapillus sp.]|nr:hypothetical protein [Thiolapillus sp.]
MRNTFDTTGIRRLVKFDLVLGVFTVIVSAVGAYWNLGVLM